MSGSGELLWLSDAIPRVIRSLSDARAGVLGLEAYQAGGHVSGQFIGDWFVEPGWRCHESWADYLLRAERDALAAVRDPILSGLVVVRDPTTRYFIAACGEADYPAHRRRD